MVLEKERRWNIKVKGEEGDKSYKQGIHILKNRVNLISWVIYYIKEIFYYKNFFTEVLILKKLIF